MEKVSLNQIQDSCNIITRKAGIMNKSIIHYLNDHYRVQPVEIYKGIPYYNKATVARIEGTLRLGTRYTPDTQIFDYPHKTKDVA